MSLPCWSCKSKNHFCFSPTSKGPAGRAAMDVNSVKYNAISNKLAQEFSYQTTKDPNFQVVVQPGLSGFNISEFGENFLSLLDCFHPDVAANEAFTVQIWNNMFQAPGKKSTTIDPNNINYFCPDPTSIIQ